MYNEVLRIIAEESHIPPEDLTEDTSLAEAGINHLLWQIVMDRVHSELGIDLERHTFDLTKITTFRDLQEPLSQFQAPSLASSPTTLSVISWDSPLETPSTGTWERQHPPTPKCVPPATSVMLQGTLLCAKRSLFLFPDASGSATSYSYLPRIAPDVTVYGLNSPYVKNAETMACTFDDLVISFCQEVQRRQPEGPYHFAGFSAGGALAFRCAQILLYQGEKVKTLTLIDASLPSGFGELPDELYNCLETSGIFQSANGKTAEWVKPHFKAMSRLLPTMRLERTSYAAIPNVRILWADRSFLDRPDIPSSFKKQSDDSEATKFLTETRTNFGPCGWAFLLPGSKIRTGKIGADHFEMMVNLLLVPLSQLANSC